MVYSSQYAFSTMIDLFGEGVVIKKRKETVDDYGNVVYTYPTSIETKAWIREVGGYQLLWEFPGYREEIELAGCFYHDTDISNGDLVQLKDGRTYEVYQVLHRKSAGETEYKEVLLTSVKG